MLEGILIAMVGAAVQAAWEHWLGGTDKITENSTVALAKRLVKKLLDKI